MNMKYLGSLRELEAFLNQYGASNMIGKEFDCAPVKALCKELKREDPMFGCFVTEGTEHELMVSVSDFLRELLKV